MAVSRCMSASLVVAPNSLMNQAGPSGCLTLADVGPLLAAALHGVQLLDGRRRPDRWGCR